MKSPGSALLISGTDTEVGKTVVTSALAAYWQTYRLSQGLAILKPLQAGTGDREWYQRLFQLNQTPEQINPLYYQSPLAPPLAAEQEGKPIDLALAWQMLQRLQQTHDWILVEGLGGLGSPVTRELTVVDLARDWRLPTLLVVPVKLGAIGQAVAHAALARQAHLKVGGIILNCVHPCTATELENWAPPDLIQSLTYLPVLGTVPFLDDPTNIARLAQIVTNWNLEVLMSKIKSSNHVGANSDQKL